MPSRKIYLIPIIAVLVFLLAVGVFFLARSFKKPSGGAVPALSIFAGYPSPVLSLEGKVKEVGVDKFTLGFFDTFRQSQGEIEVVTDGKTRFLKENSPIPYQFKEASPSGTIQGVAEAADFGALRVGGDVRVNFDKDLRELKGNQATAAVVTMLPVANQIKGRVIGIGSGVLEVNGMVFRAGNSALPGESEKVYRVRIAPETEIARLSVPRSITESTRVVRASPNDIQTGMEVLVYIEGGVGSNDILTAAKIDLPSVGVGSATGSGVLR